MPGYGGEPAYGGYAPQSAIQPADMGTRSVAYIIDYAIIFGVVIACYILSFILLFALKGIGAIFMLLLYLVMFVVAFGYHPYFEATRGGQTIGKKMKGIKVVKEDGSPCDWNAALIRRLGLIIDAIVFGFIPGYFIANGDPMHQRLGDKWAKTYVVPAATPVQPAPVMGAAQPGLGAPQSPYVQAPPPQPAQQYGQPYVQAPPPPAAMPPQAQPAQAPYPQQAPPPPQAQPPAAPPPAAPTQAMPAVQPPPTAPSPSAQTQAFRPDDLDLGGPPQQ